MNCSRWISVMIACLGGLILAGCSGHATDQRFERRTAERAANIDRVVDHLAAREAEAPARLSAISAVIAAGPPRHQANLQRTLATVRAMDLRDRQRWPRTWAATRQRVARELAGNPANIDDSIARMFY